MEKSKAAKSSGRAASFFKSNIGTIIGLILLVGIISVSTPKFMTPSNMLNLMKSNSVNAIISCGMLLAILMGEPYWVNGGPDRRDWGLYDNQYGRSGVGGSADLPGSGRSGRHD